MMKPFPKARLSSLVIYILALASSLAQQSDKSPQTPAPRIRESTPVLLDIVQSSRQATKLVPLSAANVILLDNRQQVPATSLHLVTGSESAATSHQLLFVIDALNSSLADVTRSEDALEAFLASNASLAQSTSILIVSDTEPRNPTARSSPPNQSTALHQRQLFVHRIPPSTDPAALTKALREYKPGLNRILEAQAAQGQTERVRLSLEALGFIANAQTLVPGAKLVVWISPGWPYLQSSATQPSEQLFNSVVYFSNLLHSGRIILDAVSPEGLTASQFPQSSFEGPRNRSNPTDIAAHNPTIQPADTFYQGFLKGAQSATDVNPNDLALQVLAIQSGGMVLQHSNNLTALLTRCAAESQSLVTIAYTPPNGSLGTRYHELAVKSSIASTSLRTRTGVYLR